MVILEQIHILGENSGISSETLMNEMTGLMVCPDLTAELEGKQMPRNAPVGIRHNENIK